MSQPLYERYKDALRRGHVAAERSRFDAALDAYGEAAAIAPDRALPLIGIGSVLRRLGKIEESLRAYEAALDRSPDDETALRARADLLAIAGRPAAAATALDRLAGVLDTAGRRREAVETAGQALGLAESRGRRTSLRALIARAEGGSEAGLAEAIADVRDRLHDGHPTPPEPAFDPGAALGAVEDALAGPDRASTRDRALTAADGLRGSGRSLAAIDACYLALETHPADVGLHLMLAELYLDHGWRPIALEKLRLVGRLVELTGDDADRERLCIVIAARVPDEPSLLALCA